MALKASRGCSTPPGKCPRSLMASVFSFLLFLVLTLPCSESRIYREQSSHNSYFIYTTMTTRGRPHITFGDDLKNTLLCVNLRNTRAAKLPHSRVFVIRDVAALRNMWTAPKIKIQRFCSNLAMVVNHFQNQSFFSFLFFLK